jgi:hypothetical protein
VEGERAAQRLVRGCARRPGCVDRTQCLPYSREYYWQRHVHLFTNQLLGGWDAEIEQCLRQALGYLRLAGKGSRRAKKLLRELKEFS